MVTDRDESFFKCLWLNCQLAHSNRFVEYMQNSFNSVSDFFSLFSAGSGMSQYTSAVPSGGYEPIYPSQSQPSYPHPHQHPYPHPHPHPHGINEVVVTKPIRSMPSADYGSISHSTIAVPTEIIVVGGCPACRIGMLEDDFTCLGVCCAIFLFPVGILCCLALKNKRCTNCGAQFWKHNLFRLNRIESDQIFYIQCIAVSIYITCCLLTDSFFSGQTFLYTIKITYHGNSDILHAILFSKVKWDTNNFHIFKRSTFV